MTTIIPSPKKAVSKTLLSYVVESVLLNGVPLTDMAVVDLLGTTPVADLMRMTDSDQLHLADAQFPTQLAFGSIKGPIYALYDKLVKIAGVSMTVAEACKKYPADFVLACYVLPDMVARFYVLFHLSERGTAWGNVASDIDFVSTKFDKDFLFTQVRDFLNRPSMYVEWEAIFGLTGMLDRKLLATKSNLQVIQLIKQDVLTPNPDRTILLDDNAATVLAKAGNYYGVNSFTHYMEAREVSVAFDGVVQALVRYGTRPEDVVDRMVKEVSK